MKQLFFALVSVMTFSAFAQNTFPTTGNVGIGTNSPTDNLQVLGGVRIGGNTYLNQTKLYFQSSLGSWSLGSQGASSNNFMIYSYDSSADFKVYTGTLERFVVKNNGNIGIGVTSPTVKLDIDGSIKTTGTITSARGYLQDNSDTQLRLYGLNGWAGIEFKDNNGNDYLWFNGQHETFAIGGGGSNVSGKKLHVEGGTSIGTGYRNSSIPINGLAIEGNVGIGTTAPSAKLQVNNYTGSGTAQSYGSITSFANSGDIGLYLGVANENIGSRGWGFSARSVGVNSSLDIIEKGLNGTRMTIESGGNVGIGTTTPSYKLDVAGDIKSSTGLFRSGTGKFTFYDDTVAGTWAKLEARGLNLGDWNTDSDYGKIVTGDYDFVLNAKDVDRFFIESDNGNVGIGTTAPGAWKLAVNGKIRAKEIKVETGWSDFVFEKEYKLPTLAEVERHIKEKGHLQDIPSAADVAKNGILLGQMNSKLLQKIEELTLYTIDQEKKIDKQEDLINDLIKRIEKLEKN